MLTPMRGCGIARRLQTKAGIRSLRVAYPTNIRDSVTARRQLDTRQFHRIWTDIPEAYCDRLGVPFGKTPHV